MTSNPLRQVVLACAALFTAAAAQASHPADHPQAVARALAHLQGSQGVLSGADSFDARDVVIDPDGRLVKVHNGNSWTPSELVADISAVPAPTH